MKNKLPTLMEFGLSWGRQTPNMKASKYGGFRS